MTLVLRLVVDLAQDAGRHLVPAHVRGLVAVLVHRQGVIFAPQLGPVLVTVCGRAHVRDRRDTYSLKKHDTMDEDTN